MSIILQDLVRRDRSSVLSVNVGAIGIVRSDLLALPFSAFKCSLISIFCFHVNSTFAIDHHLP